MLQNTPKKCFFSENKFLINFIKKFYSYYYSKNY